MNSTSTRIVSQMEAPERVAFQAGGVSNQVRVLLGDLRWEEPEIVFDGRSFRRAGYTLSTIISMRSCAESVSTGCLVIVPTRAFAFPTATGRRS